MSRELDDLEHDSDEDVRLRKKGKPRKAENKGQPRKKLDKRLRAAREPIVEAEPFEHYTTVVGQAQTNPDGNGEDHMRCDNPALWSAM